MDVRVKDLFCLIHVLVLHLVEKSFIMLNFKYSQLQSVVVFFFAAMLFSCQSSLPTEDEDPEPDPGVVTIKSWTTPEKIEIPGLDITRSYSIPLSLYIDTDNEPRLLIRIPQDEAPGQW